MKANNVKLPLFWLLDLVAFVIPRTDDYLPEYKLRLNTSTSHWFIFDRMGKKSCCRF